MGLATQRTPPVTGSPLDVVAADPLGPAEVAVLRHIFELQPGYAVFLGLHEFDGRLPDLSRGATDRWVARADGLLDELRAVASAALAADRRLDRQLLELLLESALFDLRDSRDYDRNPMIYPGTLSLTAYMVREYGPVESRARAMLEVLRGAPAFLARGLGRLDDHLPKPFVDLTLSIASGLPAHFAEAEAMVRERAPALGPAFAEARPAAEAALGEFLRRMREEYGPRATAEFALGPERFQRLLYVREGLRLPYPEVLAQGEADLARNQARLAEIAASSHPAVGVGELLEGLYRDHPSAEGLVPEAQGLVASTLRLVSDQDLASVPDGASCRVAETPSYGRALSTASMHPPGPFDRSGTEGIYFVTPVDPAWPAPRQEEWLRSLNRTMLRNITIHEVYPGHYLQFLHFRSAAGSLTRKTFLSSAFTEGWAHYCEELAIEAGLARGEPAAEVAQLHDALLRDCRLIASIGLHAQGWSVERATELFMREAHFERLPAEREAIRGTFNPEYFCYTLGKLAIRQARAASLAPVFGGSWRRFHDRLLGFGAPPVGLLGELLGAA